MHKAKAFFFVCAGLLLVACHLGATSVEAQAPGNPIVGAAGGPSTRVCTANGDVYLAEDGKPMTLVGNVFSGGTRTPGSPIVGLAAGHTGGVLCAVTAGGDSYCSLGYYGATWVYQGNVFNGETPAPENPVVVCAGDSRPGVFYAATAGGDVFWSPGYYGATWVYQGNVFSGATPVQGVSIGQLKVKYAAPAAGK